ncbi:MAG TPA: uroporphyrinogen decarboxylase family protein [Anaerolineae bacterium]|nr:uroporphyrinogen decarboxylase family protein [Anaerolineae bacterium]HPL27920.1 uroporphyrinogen decarboxylase family protein [Anaerolineae bacterium]
MSIPISKRIARYNTWLKREPTGRPLIGPLWEPDIPPLPEFLERVGNGNPISPEQLRPDLFLPHVERWHRCESQLVSDVITPFAPAFGIPWVEAIAGCPVVAHPGSLWAGPAIESYTDRRPIVFDRDSPWLRSLIDLTRALVTLANGRFPVALPQMRGPLDVLAAMRTPQQMSIDLIEAPDEVTRILGELTDLWVGIAQAVLEVIPPFHGGYCTRMKMWAPGCAITPQNDVSALISPKMYKRFALPFDQQIASRFPYHSFHMHSTEHHQIANLLTLQQLTAIQLTLEHTLGGPSLDITLAAARRVLREKPLLLVAFDTETADLCLQELPAAGLAVMIGFNDYEIPDEIARWFSDHCRP